MNTTEETSTMSTPRAIWQAIKFTFYLTVGIYFAYSVGVQMGTTF